MSKIRTASRAPACLMLSLVIFCDPTNSAFATTVVVLRGPDFVILGSDSRVVGIRGDKISSSSTCKIRQFDNVFLALAGVAGDGRRFDAFQIAARTAKGKSDVVEIANDFEMQARRPLTEYLQGFYRESPGPFRHYCANRMCLQVAFASVDRGTPKLSVRGFFVTVRNGKVVVTPAIRHRIDCPGTCTTPGEQAVLGVNDEAMSLFDRTPHFWKLNGIVGGMEQLIGAEISAHGDVVGLPISILQLDRTGAQFLPQHQGVCGDPQK